MDALLHTLRAGGAGGEEVPDMRACALAHVRRQRRLPDLPAEPYRPAQSIDHAGALRAFTAVPLYFVAFHGRQLAVEIQRHALEQVPAREGRLRAHTSSN
jgi:hypothetical protein